MSKPRIYTSYFANLRNIPSNIEPMAISLFTPSFYQGKRLWELAPSKEILNSYKEGLIDEDQYRELYLDLLMTKSSAIERCVKYFKEHEVVLVCYEGKGKFCHRHILGELFSGLGFDVVEY